MISPQHEELTREFLLECRKQANSLNALLKIIEEPGKNNYFFLINNKSKPLLETIKSRSLEIKIVLNEKKRIEIINHLIDFFNL